MVNFRRPASSPCSGDFGNVGSFPRNIRPGNTVITSLMSNNNVTASGRGCCCRRPSRKLSYLGGICARGADQGQATGSDVRRSSISINVPLGGQRLGSMNPEADAGLQGARGLPEKGFTPAHRSMRNHSRFATYVKFSLQGRVESKNKTDRPMMFGVGLALALWGAINLAFVCLRHRAGRDGQVARVYRLPHR